MAIAQITVTLYLETDLEANEGEDELIEEIVSGQHTDTLLTELASALARGNVGVEIPHSA